MHAKLQVSALGGSENLSCCPGLETVLPTDAHLKVPAAATQAATQAFDKQLPGTPVFFLNLSQFHKHCAVLILRA